MPRCSVSVCVTRWPCFSVCFCGAGLSGRRTALRTFAAGFLGGFFLVVFGIEHHDERSGRKVQGWKQRRRGDKERRTTGVPCFAAQNTATQCNIHPSQSQAGEAEPRGHAIPDGAWNEEMHTSLDAGGAEGVCRRQWQNAVDIAREDEVDEVGVTQDLALGEDDHVGVIQPDLARGTTVVGV